MSAKYFLDTNIFVYSFDETTPKKRKMALNLISNALATGQGVISWQIVQEFLNVALKKFSPRLEVADAKLYLDKSLMPLCRSFAGPTAYQSALDLHKTTGYSFYDCLVLAAALESECDILYSEDLQHGQKISGLKIQNPFV